MLEIYRSHPDEQFAIIPNGALRDPNLSYAARGVLHELLSHSTGWETNADALSRLARQHRGDKRGEGRRAIRSAFAELEEQGYIVRRRIQGKGKRFVTVLQVYDTPGHRGAASGTSMARDPWAEESSRGTASGTSVGGTSASGTSVSGTSSRSTNQRTTNEEDAFQEDSSALVDTRAAAADAAARDEESELRSRYESVRRLDDTDLRNALLAFERKRPRIFRECRRDALAQLEGENRKALKGNRANVEVDRLSYMYALRHYAPDWPAWLLRPLPDPRKLRAA